MRPTPYVASLRVYEPVNSFLPEDQAKWNQIAITSPTGWDEQKKALRRTIVTEPPALKPDGAHVLEHEGKKYIAPWSTAARCWAALDDFKSSLPVTLSKFFLPQKIEDAINVNSEVVEDKVSHIITATWRFHLAGLLYLNLQIDFVEAMMMVPSQYFEPRFQVPNNDAYLLIRQW